MEVDDIAVTSSDVDHSLVLLPDKQLVETLTFKLPPLCFQVLMEVLSE